MTIHEVQPPPKLKSGQEWPIVPYALQIANQTHVYRLPDVTRLRLLYATPTTVRGEPIALLTSSASVLSVVPLTEHQHQAYCCPDDAAWERVRQHYAAYRDALDALAQALRAIGSYDTHLAAHGGFKAAPNPLTPTVIAICDPANDYRNWVNDGSDGSGLWDSLRIERIALERHTPFKLRPAGDTLSMPMQRDHFPCVDDATWHGIRILHERAIAARTEWKQLLTELGTYDDARDDGRYGGLATVTSGDPACDQAMLDAHAAESTQTRTGVVETWITDGTDLDDDLLGRLRDEGYTWHRAKWTPDGRWHHVVQRHGERHRLLRRERLVALVAQQPVSLAMISPIGESTALTGVLSPAMERHVARTLAADVKGGEALWEKAEAVADARNDAKRGEWASYLAATGQHEREAQRLLLIAQRGRGNPAFRDAVIRGWLRFSVAALAAQADDALLERLLTQETPPTRQQIQAEKTDTGVGFLSANQEPKSDTGVGFGSAASNGKRQSQGLAPLMSSDSEEWYTPQHIVQCVLRFFDDEMVDLDPCSPTNNPRLAPVPARAYYTKADDGLSKPWFLNVYMNPPYGDQVGVWVARLLEAYTTGEIAEAIALLPARTDTAWFQPLHTYPRCFIRGRLRFDSPEGLRAGAPFPSVLVYLGTDLARFREVFGDLGKVAEDPDAQPVLIEEDLDGAPPWEGEPLASQEPPPAATFDPLRDVEPNVLAELSRLGYDLVGTADRGIARWYTFRDPGDPDGAITLAAGEIPGFLVVQQQFAQQRQAAKAAAAGLSEPWQAGAISAAHPTTHAWRPGRVGWEAACGAKSSKDDLAWSNTVTCSTCQRSALLRPASATEAAPTPDPMPAELRQRAKAVGITIESSEWNIHFGIWKYNLVLPRWMMPPATEDCRTQKELAGVEALVDHAEQRAAQAAPAVEEPLEPALWQTAVAQLDDSITALTAGEIGTARGGIVSALVMLLSSDAARAGLIAECKMIVSASAEDGESTPTFAAAARAIVRAVVP